MKNIFLSKFTNWSKHIQTYLYRENKTLYRNALFFPRHLHSNLHYHFSPDLHSQYLYTSDRVHVFMNTPASYHKQKLWSVSLGHIISKTHLRTAGDGAVNLQGLLGSPRNGEWALPVTECWGWRQLLREWREYVLNAEGSLNIVLGCCVKLLSFILLLLYCCNQPYVIC